MPVRKAITEKDRVYFITFTCTNWLPLFKICNVYDAVYNWFDKLKQQGHYIIGYVIMPSHVHAVIAFSNTGKSINGIVSNGKRFIAYDLVKLSSQLSEVFERLGEVYNFAASILKFITFNFSIQQYNKKFKTST